MSKKGLSGIFSNVLLKISKKESSRTGLFFGFVCSIVAMYLFMGGFFTPLDNYLTSLFLQVEYYQPEHQDLVVVAKKDQATSELIQKNPGRQEFASLFEILGQGQTIKRPGGGKARPFSFFTLMLGFLKNVKEPIIRNSMVDYWGYTAKNLEFFSKNPQVGGYTSLIKLDSLIFTPIGGSLLKTFAGPPRGPFLMSTLGLFYYKNEILWIDLEDWYQRNQERVKKGLPETFPTERDFEALLDETRADFEANRKAVDDLAQRWQMFLTKIQQANLALKIDMSPTNLFVREIELVSNLYFQIELVAVFDPLPAEYFVPPASVIAFDFILQGKKGMESDQLLQKAIADCKSDVILAAYTIKEEEYENDDGSFYLETGKDGDMKKYSSQDELASSTQQKGTKVSKDRIKRFVTRLIMPDEQFVASNTHLGMIDIATGDKNFVTQIPMFTILPEQKRIEPSFSLMTAMLALDAEQPNASETYVEALRKELDLIYPLVESGTFDGPLKIKDNLIPVDQNGRLFVKFIGSTKKNSFKEAAFPSVSFFECFAEKHLKSFYADASDIGKKRIRRAHNRILSYGVNKGRKVILAGPFEVSDMDFYPTPLNVKTPFTVQNEPLMGVEIHANAVLNIMKKNYLRHPDPRHTYFATLVTCLLLGLILDFISPFVGAFIAFGFVAAASYYGSFSYNHLGQVIYVSSMVVSYPMIWALATLTNYLRQRARAQNTKDMFSRFVAADVVQYMLENPELVKPGGQKVELTIFFSDVAGFTSISEALTPEELVVLLNEYLGAMTDLLFEYGGTLDKFIGDAVMAFWNYPREQADHAEKACLCALAMQRKINELQIGWAERGLPRVSARAGLNTAGVVVGYMGSNKAQMNFTCMGDGVNLASRLEGANKEYGTAMMISDATYQKAKSKVTARFLDFLAVKGKKEPVKVYELVCEKGNEPPDWDELHQLYDSAIQLHLDRKWDEAIATFEKILARWPEDGPSQTYLHRCHEYIQNPPPEGWDGRYILTHK